MDTLYFGLSDKGRRKNNEDYISHFEPSDPAELKSHGCLYIVADGVGGAAKGERASQYAAERVLFEYYQPQSAEEPGSLEKPLIEPLGYLRAILRRVNEEIYEYATQRDTRMATTVALAVIREGYLYCANIGDSRAYLIRDGRALQLTNDHSLVGEMVQHGEMTETEAMASSIKNRLTRSLGGDPEVTVETYKPLPLKDGDKVLLCTDGLTRYATAEQIAGMSAVGTSEEIVRRFIKFANDSGGADNVSVIAVSYQKDGAFVQITPVHRPQDPASMPTQPGVGDELKTVVLPKKTSVERLEEKRRKERVLISRLAVLAAVAVALAVVIALSSRIAFTGLPAVATSTPTLSFTETPPATAPLPPPATETPISAPAAVYVCVYEIKLGDTQSGLQSKYGLSSQPSMYCTVTAEGKCSVKNKIEDSYTIPEKLHVIFDDIPDESTCGDKGGQWIEDISPTAMPAPNPMNMPEPNSISPMAP